MTILVALFVIVQAFLGSYVSSAQASPQNLDYYGNVICFGGNHASDDDTPAQKQIPDCCNIGCGMFAAALEARIIGSCASPHTQTSAFRYFVDLSISISKSNLVGISLPRAPPSLGQV